MRKSVSILLITLMVFTVGCWDLRPLEELALIQGLGVDMSDMDREMLQFTFIHPLFAQEARDVRLVKVINSYSLEQGLIHLQHQTDERPALGTLLTMVFSEEATRNGSMHKVLAEYDSLRESKLTAWVCVVRGADAREVMQLSIPNTPRISIFLSEMFRENMLTGRIPRSDTTTYLTKHYTTGITPVIPVIELTGPGEEKTGFLLAGVAVIGPSGKLKGYLTDSETVMFMLLTGEMVRGRLAVNLTLEGGENVPVTAYVQNSSVKVRAEIVNDKPVIYIKSKINFSEANAVLPGNKPPTENIVRQLETALARDIQGNMAKVINKSQIWGADIFGFGRHVQSQHYRWFRGKKWETEFKRSKINVEVKVSVKRTGTLITQ